MLMTASYPAYLPSGLCTMVTYANLSGLMRFITSWSRSMLSTSILMFCEPSTLTERLAGLNVTPGTRPRRRPTSYAPSRIWRVMRTRSLPGVWVSVFALTTTSPSDMLSDATLSGRSTCARDVRMVRMSVVMKIICLIAIMYFDDGFRWQS